LAEKDWVTGSDVEAVKVSYPHREGKRTRPSLRVMGTTHKPQLGGRTPDSRRPDVSAGCLAQRLICAKVAG
jgi:hypothetical protein